MMGGYWLTALIFIPLLGACLVLLQERADAIWRAAFIFSLVPLAISLYLFAEFEPGQSGYQFAEQYPWIPGFGISYHVGIDGISLFLVVLTTILITLSILYSGGGDIESRPREFCFFMLVLESGLLGGLLAVDLFLFYVFWEVMLVPMYFLIGIWGHGRKVYAALKFALFTMIGSLLMLVAILYLVHAAAGRLRLARLRPAGPLWRPAVAHRGALALRRVRARVCDQGADVAVPHLAARRPHRGADGGLGDSGGRYAEDGHYGLVRFAFRSSRWRLVRALFMAMPSSGSYTARWSRWSSPT